MSAGFQFDVDGACFILQIKYFSAWEVCPAPEPLFNSGAVHFFL